MNILVTGGAGFIGSALCRHLVSIGENVLNVDKLTYAGNLASLRSVESCPNYRFVNADICNEAVLGILAYQSSHHFHYLARLTSPPPQRRPLGTSDSVPPERHQVLV